jgi:HAD superfamily hydrolase (TIGR01450 family)
LAAPAKLTDLLDRYDAVFLDAYGVLNDAGGALPGAAELVAELDRRALPWLVLTNDCSRLPATIAARLTRFGVPVPADRVVSSGVLLAARDLTGRRTIVLGTDESRALARAAGAAVVAPADRDAPPEVIVVADDAGFELLPETEATISAAVRALDAGVALELLLPNPDLLYPRPGGEVGLTAGAIAALIELALDRLRPGAPRFVPLGKPHPPLYAEARRRVGAAARLLAVGDTIETDVAGAVAAGIDVAYLESAVSRWRPGQPEPTWILRTLFP